MKQNHLMLNNRKGIIIHVIIQGVTSLLAAYIVSQFILN